MDITLLQLWQMEMDQLKEEQGSAPDPDLWRWSPLDIKEFDIMLHVALTTTVLQSTPAERHVTIAEAGSGIGTKLYLARHKYGLTETGYEINDGYLAKSAELGVTAYKQDLGDPGNQPDWSLFDIVYIARPFKDDAREAAWERSVHEAMRPGAVLIAAFAAVKPYTWPCYYRRSFRGVWAKPELALESPQIHAGAALASTGA
jgi:hypothetical protein